MCVNEEGRYESAHNYLLCAFGMLYYITSLGKVHCHGPVAEVKTLDHLSGDGINLEMKGLIDVVGQLKATVYHPYLHALLGKLHIVHGRGIDHRP